MDPRWSPEDDAFRQDVRAWLAEALPSWRAVWGDDVPQLDALLDWESRIRAAGYSAISWPVEFGGQGLASLWALVFNEEYFRARAPRRLNYPALGLLGPTLMEAGSAEQQARLLPRVLTCEDIWCQGFSEPDAGSDLASLRTRAVRDGDRYVVNGQKTWVSNGPRATRMFALVRTGTPESRHRGITYLLVDLLAPGVEVRPIKQISGQTLFADVFLTDVVVPVRDRVGEEGDGWRVARATLGVERDASRYPALHFQWYLDEVRAIATAAGRDRDLDFRVAYARLQAAVRRYEVNAYASLTSPRPEAGVALASTTKLVRSLLQMAIAELGMQTMGDRAEVGRSALPDGVEIDWYERYWHTRASSIYAGTNEIQRDIIAERLLGLPRDR